MHATTRRLLEKLLSHAESEESSGKRKAFNLTEGRAAAYLDEPDLGVRQRIHSEMIELERAGIVTIKWDRRAGDRGLICALSAESPAKLAPALGVLRHKDALSQAEVLLADQIDHPRVQLALAQWRQGKTVRTYGPADALILQQVLKTLRYTANLPRPSAVRRVSAALFGDTKRVERWTALIDFVMAPDDEMAIRGTGRLDAEIFAAARMIRFAQPLLMAGRHSILVGDGRALELQAPYEGIAPEIFAGMATTPSYVLTVENLTTFHELAGLRANDGGLILFTAGNFSPAFERSYRCLAEQSRCRRFFHWGDVDGKGIEIASRLAQLLEQAGDLRLIPFRMDVAPIDVEHGEIESLDDKTVVRIVRLCQQHGWDSIAAAVQKHRKRIEQESQPLELPVQLTD